MEYVLNVQYPESFASELTHNHEITERAAKKMAQEHLDQRVVPEEGGKYEEAAKSSELVSVFPLKEVIGPNTKKDGDHVVSTL